MGEKIKNKPVAACWIMFAILILVHGFEAIVLRMDETFFGENFINKVFGIVLIFVVLALVKWAPKDIGFTAKNFLRNIGIVLTIWLIRKKKQA
jgi:hypothetical protein